MNRLQIVSGVSLFAAVAILAGVPHASAAMGQGSRIVGGAINISQTDIEDASVDQTMIMGTFDYMYRDNMSVGISPFYVSQELEDKAGDVGTTEQSTLYLPARWDYYWPQAKNPSFLPYAGVDLGFVAVDYSEGDAPGSEDDDYWWDDESESDDTSEDVSEFGLLFGVHAGVRYFLTDNVLISSQLNYFKSAGMDVDADMLALTVGLNYVFGGK